MAYITKEQIKEKKQKIVDAFPRKDGWKFSVHNNHYSQISVTILEGPVEFNFENDSRHIQINKFNPKWYWNSGILKFIINIINEGNYNNSDSMTDYFDVGWYTSLEIGQWDKPYKYNNPSNLENDPLVGFEERRKL